MKTIIYKAPGEQLTSDRFAGTERKSVAAIKEIPFSEENLQCAKAEALPGSLQILEQPAPASAELDVRQRIVLQDRSTEKLYELYVENGKLMMEVM